MSVFSFDFKQLIVCKSTDEKKETYLIKMKCGDRIMYSEPLTYFDIDNLINNLQELLKVKL